MHIPPIKIQGKKTKLLPFIMNNLPDVTFKKWVEPFLGSGVVGFNVQPKIALFADSNPHIIHFYNAIKNKTIDFHIAKDFLQEQGKLLSQHGESYYLEVRIRFNQTYQPLDFLFLNRCCFNGMIRFNRKLQFNVPYGHKPERFAQAYVTKIVNQIKQVATLIQHNDWNFICQDFKTTLAQVQPEDFVYCDPPYIGRHVDYYDTWTEQNERELQQQLAQTSARFMISTWHSNEFRTNNYLKTIWQEYPIVTTKHFYHVGAKSENRHAMTEALILNYSTLGISPVSPNSQQLAQLGLF